MKTNTKTSTPRVRPITPKELNEHVRMLRWLAKNAPVTKISEGLFPTIAIYYQNAGGPSIGKGGAA
jgi:hypothetical protein